MTPEIEAIFEAARAEGGTAETIEPLVLAMGRQAVDRAAGVEDVTSALKGKLEEAIKKREAKEVEVKTQSDELSALRTEIKEALDAKAEQEAADKGFDHKELERMAEERSNAKFAVLSSEHSDNMADLEARVSAAESDRELLVEEYFKSLVNNDLVVNAPQANPTLYTYLQAEARRFYAPRKRADGEPWWKGNDGVKFDIVDPGTGTKLRVGDQDMTGAELVKARANAEWKAFMMPTGRGGGAQSGEVSTAGQRLPFDAPASDLMDAALNSHSS